MGYIAELKRNLHFAKYNYSPFRFSLLSRHLLKRGLSRLGLKSGFRIIDLALTYECNFNCQHCSALIMKRPAPTMNLDDYKRVVAQARPLDVLSWNITGGEPLLVDWLDDLIPILEPKTHYVSIQTNCSLLDKNRAKQLARLGVNCITTSLDSIVPAEHDTFRGFAGSYQKVFEGLRNAHAAGLQALVGATVTHQNLRSSGLVDLIKAVNKEGAICLFNLAIPCGRWQGESDVVLRGDDRQYLLELLARFPQTSTDHEVGRNAIGCPAGMEKVYITAYGEVIPCPFIHISFGNILEESLVEIVARMRSVPEFAKYQKICLGAEDLDFQKEVLAKIYSKPSPPPVSYKEIYDSSLFLPPEQQISCEDVACSLCASSQRTLAAAGYDYEYWVSPQQFSYVRCNACGHLYLNPRPPASTAPRLYPANYYTLSGRHSKGLGRLIAFFKKRAIRGRLLYFRQLFNKPVKVLEVGCGDCSLLMDLKTRFPRLVLTGLDLASTPALVEECRRLGITFIKGKIEDVLLPSAEYDLIIMNQLIEHLWDLNGVMTKLKQALAPGGYLSIETVNIAGYDRRFFKDACWGGYYFPRHMNLFSFASLQRLMEKHELVVTKQLNLVAPICWIFSCHAWLQKRYGRNNIVSRFFTDANPFLLALFTVLDSMAIKMGATSSNQKTIARKP